jgi:hypothetical protein
MIMRGEREAYVNRYISKRLIPLIRNFIKSKCIELELFDLQSKSNIPLPSGKMISEAASHLRAGFLYALPSIGLLLPNIPISLSSLSGLAGNSDAEFITSNRSYELLQDGDISFDFLPKKLNLLLNKFNHSLDRINENQEAILDQMKIMNDGIANLIGILISGQIAVVIGLAIGAVIQIRGSMLLAETEEMLENILNKTESMWPQIENNLRMLLPAFEGVVDHKTLERSKLVLTKINTMKS